jgi:hypothetical protein
MSEYREADEADVLEQETPAVPNGEDESGDEEYPHGADPDDIEVDLEDPDELDLEDLSDE